MGNEARSIVGIPRGSSDEGLLSFFGGASIGFGEYDSNLRYVRVNEVLAIINGVPAIAHIGRTIADILPSLAPQIEPILRRVLTIGEAVQVEIQAKIPDQPSVVKTWKCDYFPLWSGDDAIIGVGAIIEDITTHKDAEVALRDSETLLRLSQEVGRIGGWDWDLTSDTIRASDTQCLLFGIQPNGGRPLPKEEWSSKVYHEDVDRIERRLQTLIEGGEYSDAEYRIHGPNGLRWLYTRCHAIRDSEGRATRLVGIDMDITERIELQNDLRALTLSLEQRVKEEVAAREAVQARLAHAEKLKSVGELTGGIAHDFNNMLTVIIGAAEELADALPESSHLRDLASQIGSAADSSAKLTANLLAFARKQPLRPQMVDVTGLVAEVRQLLKSSIGRRIVIGQISRDNVEPAYVDPAQLSSAIVNLAINARDAMPDGGTITIEIDTKIVTKENGAAWDCEPGRYSTIAVIDTGIGIPESNWPRVFEPFFSTKEVGKGTGLGLSSVFGFIKQSGGHIQVSSKEGVGTTFRIYLPTKSPRPDRLDVSSVTIPASQGKVILCVEDDPIVRKFVSEQVCRFGYRTIVANDAREALSIVEGNADIDLLFSDVVMPGGMDGWQLADHVAQRRPDLPVLLTTGYSDVLTDRVDSRAHLLLLPKPYRSRELESMIRLALDAHPSSPEAMANSHSASSWHISDLA